MRSARATSAVRLGPRIMPSVAMSVNTMRCTPIVSRCETNDVALIWLRCFQPWVATMPSEQSTPTVSRSPRRSTAVSRRRALVRAAVPRTIHLTWLPATRSMESRSRTPPPYSTGIGSSAANASYDGRNAVVTWFCIFTVSAGQHG